MDLETSPKLIEIRAPMSGVFYCRPAPEQPPYVQEGDPVSALERQGILVPSLCRSGECSLCRVKILSGRVFEPPGIPVRRSDRRYGYTHACVTYPLGDLEVMV